MEMETSSYSLFSGRQNQDYSNKLNRPIIISDRIRTPENMGMILRLAANINALKVLFIVDGDLKFRNYKINRAASGAAEKVNWQMIHSADLEKEIPDDYRLIALETLPDVENIFDFTLPSKPAFIIGNEVNGISKDLLNCSDGKIFIPIPGSVTSLNVSHALAIGLFEWLRQMTSQK